MALIVQKYGGTSVGSVERIQTVAKKIKALRDAGNQLVVSVSAMSGETNRMTTLARVVQDIPSLREMDVLLTTGEQVTISLLSMALQQLGCDAISYTGAQVRITTDSEHGKARIKSIDDHRIRESLEQGKVVVVAGFQGVDELIRLRLLWLLLLRLMSVRYIQMLMAFIRLIPVLSQML